MLTTHIKRGWTIYLTEPLLRADAYVLDLNIQPEYQSKVKNVTPTSGQPAR